MVAPSEVDISKRFVDTPLGNYEKETIARNIVVIRRIIAEAKSDDRWHPFRMEEYIEVRNATSEEPVTPSERQVLGALATSGHLVEAEDGSFSVTATFLGIVAQFATPESVTAYIAK